MDGVRAAITGRMGWSGGSVSGSWPAICAISPRPRSNKAQQERNSAVKLGIVEPPSPLQARLSISHRILVLQQRQGICCFVRYNELHVNIMASITHALCCYWLYKCAIYDRLRLSMRRIGKCDIVNFAQQNYRTILPSAGIVDGLPLPQQGH